MKKILISFPFLIIALALTIYFINPFGVPSWDPRSRILGVTLYSIPSRAMEPNLVPGNRIVVSSHSKNYSFGDLLVFRKSPTNHTFVFRLIGSAGDNVELVDNQLMINGVKAQYETIAYGSDILKKERFANVAFNIYESSTVPATNFEIIVPEDTFFLLGDNRHKSSDSRYMGNTHKDEIVGKVIYIF